MVPEAFAAKPHLPLNSNKRQFKVSEAPSFGLSVLTALFPVILMTITTVYELVVDHGVTPKNPSTTDQIIRLIGAPGIAMLISLLFALWSMGIHQHKTNKAMTATIEDATKSIAMLLLIIGGGGAFKQILIDGGVGKAVAQLFSGSSISPLILGWLVAASHVNDAGFWMFREYFDLTVKQTLLTWTMLETIIAFCGLGGVLALNAIFH